MRVESMNLKDYNIKFSGLKLGEHSFDYQLNNEFFELFDYHEFHGAELSSHVDMLIKSNGLNLDIKVLGTVTVPCDITTDLYDQPIEGTSRLVVKFGEEYDDSNEEILVLPLGEHTINVAQYIYETAVLAVPLKRVSPAAQNGTKGEEIRQKLQELSPEKNKKEETDPRWDKLKNLLD